MLTFNVIAGAPTRRGILNQDKHYEIQLTLPEIRMSNLPQLRICPFLFSGNSSFIFLSVLMIFSVFTFFVVYFLNR